MQQLPVKLSLRQFAWDHAGTGGRTEKKIQFSTLFRDVGLLSVSVSKESRFTNIKVILYTGFHPLNTIFPVHCSDKIFFLHLKNADA